MIPDPPFITLYAFIDVPVHIVWIRRDGEIELTQTLTYPPPDHVARLAQLAQWQATTAAIHKQELENCGAAWEDERARRNAAEDALDLQAAALGETRQALQQLTEKYDALLSRVDTTGSADALVPQPPTGDQSTSSPVKEQECQ